jgi:hypothetical protein
MKRLVAVTATVLLVVTSSLGARAEELDQERDSTERRSRDGTSPLDHFRLGVLGGVGFPRPFAIEGMIKVERVLGLGVEYSVLPATDILGAQTRFSALAADVRLFPFRGPFFVGLRAGRQRLAATGAVTIARYGSRSESAEVDSMFLNPRIGLLWTWDPGITLGIDAGVELPIAVTASNTLPKGTPESAEVARVEKTLGRTPLPTIDLLRVGFLL